MADHDKNKDFDRPRPRFSPFSPFPYGSPLAKMNNLQTSFSGSPGQKMLLGTSLHQASTTEDKEVMTPRMKGREMYGGPVMFGSSARRSRLLSAGPYTAALRTRASDKEARLERVSVTFPPSVGMAGPPPSSLPSTAPSSPHSSPGPSSSPPAPLSSSARVILSTLEKLSTGGTPITDAKRMPLASQTSTTRIEKRKLLETELNCSLSSSPSRRSRLGGGGLALALAGPPLRKNFSPSLNTSSSSASTSASSISTTPQSCKSLPENRLREVTENQSGRESRVFSDNAIVNSTKSSLKMKSRVTESGRSRVDLNSGAPPCPPGPTSPPVSSNSTQLKVDTLPVFNFGSAIKPPNSISPSSESKTIPLESPAPPEVLERNNNSKSPFKRQCETDNKTESDSPKKIKTTFSQISPALPKISPNVGSIPNLRTAAPALVASTSSKSFIFAAPKSVIAETKSQSAAPALKKYSFSLPILVSTPSETRETITNGPGSSIPRASSLSSSVPSFNFKTSAVTLMEPETAIKKMMPDITNNTLRKTILSDKLKGSNSNSGLPDVTASTGFGGFLPAKELKTGSVMDILGKNL